ncbi:MULTISPECIES: mannose-6-phosphate isomerase, class I [unclassified Solwaraspora]|uniref:mannose-6-phosphate isomerase, class I n=1 Tax=unclassified Solwaraspora TaxID=2627926 RepID=UPI00248ABF00|nr:MULTISPECIES: mannose-6-phosphate isomerase, class I [unclassified Solwaraspora]WBB96146.1 mannose-6-phosphate isomerase, class I [Solwaraspora sp. WMMA2059]WBC19950.1 mannose-6-phosphate isomerase, class I [Solwaraspora sp. WMMA2080]WJK32454.1 mannose-6-phosphate isomerase, class I [Solwaraspora sp. WMMA2065]
MELLTGRIRDYAWGSRTVIAQLQGRPAPAPGPEAELWLGAHPGAPSQVRRGAALVGLPELIDQDPVGWLGEPTATRFDGRLPYLMKVLAAETPLSLQAHPDAAQARAGYAAQSKLPATSAGRNYVDPHHKPELLVALSEFDALCGFRVPQLSAEVLAALGVDELEPVTKALRVGPDGLPEALERLLRWPRPQRPALVAAAVAGADRLPTRYAADAALLRRLAGHYPADPGVLVALLLNQVTLAPGEAIWMPAGNLHAYLRGAGVEIMAASDNVLRGGLTPKHVDVAELLRVLRFEVLDDPVVRARPVDTGVVTWPAPATEFALHRVVLDAGARQVSVPVEGPRVVLCVAGEVAVDDGVAAVPVRAGQAAVGPAGGTPLVVSGAGTAFVASVASAG